MDASSRLTVERPLRNHNKAKKYFEEDMNSDGPDPARAPGSSAVRRLPDWGGETRARKCRFELVPRLRDPNLLNAFAALADDLRMVLKASGRGESCGQEAANNPRLR
jgi:hypothetical protein